MANEFIQVNCDVCGEELKGAVLSGAGKCENLGCKTNRRTEPEGVCKKCDLKIEDHGASNEHRCKTNRRVEPDTVHKVDGVVRCKECDEQASYNTGTKTWECIECSGAVKAKPHPSIDEPDREEPQTGEYLEPMRSELLEMVGLPALNVLGVYVDAIITKRVYEAVELADKPSFIPLKDYENYSGLRSGDRFNHKGKTFHVIQEATFIPGMRELEVK